MILVDTNGKSGEPQGRSCRNDGRFGDKYDVISITKIH